MASMTWNQREHTGGASPPWLVVGGFPDFRLHLGVVHHSYGHLVSGQVCDSREVMGYHSGPFEHQLLCRTETGC
jgi:hypothetical protein